MSDASLCFCFWFLAGLLYSFVDVDVALFWHCVEASKCMSICSFLCFSVLQFSCSGILIFVSLGLSLYLIIPAAAF